MKVRKARRHCPAVDDHRRAGAGLLISTLVVLLSVTIGAVATRKLERQIGVELQELPFHMHDKLHRGLFGRPRDLRLAATLEPFVDPEASPRCQEALLRWLRRVPAECALIGLADGAGTVIANTDGERVGDRVAQEAWFRRGREGPYLGAVKASAGLPAVDRRAQGRALSTLPRQWCEGRQARRGARRLRDLDVGGGRRTLAPGARAQAARNGNDRPGHKGIVLLGPTELLGTRLDVPIAHETRAGSTAYVTAVWPDGETYVTGFTAGSRLAQDVGLGRLVLARQKAAVASIRSQTSNGMCSCGSAVTALLFVMLGWLGAKWIAALLRALTAAADRLKQESDRDSLPTSERYAEVASLSGSLAALLASLRQNEERLRALALHDSLTGLPNRLLLRDRLRQAVAQSQRRKRPASAAARGLL